MEGTLNDPDYRNAIVKVLASAWHTNEFTVEIALKIYKDLITRKEDINSPTLYVGDQGQPIVGKKTVKKALRLLASAKILVREIDKHNHIVYKLNPETALSSLPPINQALNDIIDDIKELLLEPTKWVEFRPDPLLTENRTLGMEKAREKKHKRS